MRGEQSLCPSYKTSPCEYTATLKTENIFKKKTTTGLITQIVTNDRKETSTKGHIRLKPTLTVFIRASLWYIFCVWHFYSWTFNPFRRDISIYILYNCRYTFIPVLVGRIYRCIKWLLNKALNSRLWRRRCTLRDLPGRTLHTEIKKKMSTGTRNEYNVTANKPNKAFWRDRSLASVKNHVLGMILTG